MRTWDVELRGTITRDVKHYECDAETEEQVREICEGCAELPRPRHHAPPEVWPLRFNYACNACDWVAPKAQFVSEPETCPKCGAGPSSALLPKQT